jgi:Heterokaryon incompatibility protein (HET)
MSGNETFIYDKLRAYPPSMRILSVLPGLEHENLRCSLSTACLSEIGPYEALSYTWGDANDKEIIQVNGQPFEVTHNLKAALLHLRLVTRVRKIWADAICINQHDVPERNRQVQMMGKIYGMAERVIVWLGERTMDSDMGMHLIEDLSSGKGGFMPLLFGSIETAENDILWKSLENLLNRAWWSRGWTVQEVVVARKVICYCGKRSTEWEDVEKAMYTIDLWGEEFDLAFSKAAVFQRIHVLRFLSEIRRDSRLNRPFSYLLYWQRFRKVSDPRDKIFSMLNLATDISSKIVIPDYSASVQRVYRDTTRKVIEYTRRLDMLRYVESNRELSEFPSWVPNWESSFPVTPFVTQYEFENLYRASGKLDAIVEADEDLNTLVLKGFHCDHVTTLGNIHGNHPTVVLESWHAMANIFKDPNHPYVSGGDIFNAFWRTLIANRSMAFSEDIPDGCYLTKAVEDDRKVFEGFFELEDLSTNSTNHMPISVKAGINDKENNFAWRMRPVVKGRRMIQSHKGYLGIVPGGTKIGDYICVLLGGDMPFILRPCGDHYVLIGECYIHGLMEGEALQLVEQELIKLQNFNLH